MVADQWLENLGDVAKQVEKTYFKHAAPEY